MKINFYKEVVSIWELYRKELKSYLNKIVADEEISNELTHEVLIKVYNSCCSDREINNVKSWLFQIAHNLAIDYLKESNKLTSTISDFESVREPQPWKELAEFVEPMINCLPENYGTPLRLWVVEGLNQHQIADKLGLSLSATKSRILRAKEMLKNKIISCFHIEKDNCGCIEGFELKESCNSLLKECKKS